MKNSVRHTKTKKSTVSPKPARKTRTKTRKPKYVSLKLELSPQNKTQTQQKPNKMLHKQQLNLFPLHPENLVQDKDMHDDHVAYLFETATDSSTTLNGLLDTSTTTTTTTTTSEKGPLSSSLTYIYRAHDSEEMCDRPNSLLRTAMRHKERDASEDRWVSYWEVVEKKEQEEVSSCCTAADALTKMMQVQGHKKEGLVGLKLDYQEILNAWSDKGPLYIQGESPQTVPDLHDDSNAVMEGWGSVGNLWRVPEMGSMKMKEKEGRNEVWKSGQREASVLRYKEKRQSRLFSKRIRYEVRKLNAQKRPRLKGRFVKRSGEV